MKDIKLIKADVCSEDMSIVDVAKEMRQKKARRFFVVDKEKKLLGIITTVDIINKVVALNKDLKIKVSDVMTKKVLSIDINEPIENTLKIMNKLKTFVCPVTENGKLIGVVSYQNIIASVVSASRS